MTMFLEQQKLKSRAAELGRRMHFGAQSLFPLISMEDPAPPAGNAAGAAPPAANSVGCPTSAGYAAGGDGGGNAAPAGYAGYEGVVHRRPPEVIEGPPVGRDTPFYGRDRYLWLQKTVLVPPAPAGCETVGLFDFGQTGADNNSGFESMLFIDGAPFQGVDQNHQEVVLTRYAGQTVTLTFLLWSGLEGGGAPRTQYHRLARADLAFRDNAVFELFYLAQGVSGTVALLPDESEERAFLTGALARALHPLDWDEDRLGAGVPAALEALRASLAARGKRTDVTVNAVGNTHIDVAWLWRLCHTREKAMRSFSTVLRLMEEFDDYVFVQSQPQLYRYIKEDAPELYRQIKERVAEGRWEADGGMWLEADCNIPSGESLSRQCLYGIRFIEEEFGKTCKFLWLPDVFGYSWAMPQIMKQCHLTTFATTKISWNQYNSAPNDLFIWRGIDGSEITAYFIDVPEPWQDLKARGSTYTGKITPYTVDGTWKRFKNKELTGNVMLAFGHGDGGGGVDRAMLASRRALDQIPGLPHVKNTRAGDFFDKIGRDLRETDRHIPVWDGELYLECHRGTYTSQAWIKRANRMSERALFEAEWLGALALLSGGDCDAAALRECWEILLRNQFHDIIPGSCIHEVYTDSRAEFALLRDRLAPLYEAALASLLTPAPERWTVFGAASFAHREAVFIPEERGGTFFAGGAPCAAQRSGNGWTVLAELPALGAAQLRFVPGCAPPAGLAPAASCADGALETELLRLEWDAGGALTRIFDKTAGRDVLRGRGNILRVYEDKPLRYDSWDIDIFYTEKYEDLPLTCEGLVENGPVRAVVRFSGRWRRSSVVQDLIVYRHCPRVDFVTSVDWHEDHRLLKALFETGIRSAKASFDIQYGHVERPAHWNTSWDWARFEVCGHKWADLSETGRGASILSDCKYGYSAHDGTLTLSLLKSSKYPDPEADMGAHSFTYALFPHAGSVEAGGTIEEAAALNAPAIVRPGAPRAPGAPGRVVRLDSSGAAVDCVKPAEDGDGIIVRLHECRGGSHSVTMTSDYPLASVEVCNILEEGEGRRETGEIRFELAPFELKSFRLRFSPRA